MFNFDKFIADSVTFRPVSMFTQDIEVNKEKLTEEIKGKKVCVIGGAGSICSSFIKAVLRFEPKSVVGYDRNLCPCHRVQKLFEWYKQSLQ